MRQRLIVGGIAAAIVVVAVVGFTWVQRSDPSNGESLVIALRPEDAAFVNLGEAIYQAHCASCHGANLEGQPNWRQRLPNGRLPAPPHDATGHTWHHPDEVLIQLTRLGPAELVGAGYESDMPGYADILTDEEILAVLSYIKSQWPSEIQAQHGRINAAAQDN